MPNLADLQRRFEAGLNAPAVEAAALAPYVGKRQRTEQGLGIYRGNIRANTSRALAAAYPVIEKIVGAEFFSGLAAQYCRRFASESGDLNEYGEFFGMFLADFPPAAEFPYLPDVARLEWRVHRAYYAADHEPFDPARLNDLAPEEHMALRARLHPACSVLQSTYPLARIWEVHQASFAGEFDVEFPDHPTYTLVYRPRFRVEVARINAAEAAFLSLCLEGESLGVALAAACQRDGSFELGQSLRDWVASSVIIDFNRGELT